MTDPISITIELDLDKHIAREYYVDPASGQEHSEAQTLEGILLSRAAVAVAQRVIGDTEYYRSIKQQATALITKKIDTAVSDAVTKVLAEPIQPTDNFGNPTGEATTLTALVNARAEAILKAPKKDSWGGTMSKSNGLLADTIDEAIRTDVKKAVKAAVDGQKEAIVARVAAESAAVLSEGLRRAIKV